MCKHILARATPRGFGSYQLLFLIFDGSLKWVIDIIILFCLVLEFFGLHMEIYRVMVFSCVFRCIWIFFLILATISMSVVGFIHIDRWVIGSPPPVFWYEFNNHHIRLSKYVLSYLNDMTHGSFK